MLTLLQPDALRITPHEHVPTHDCAPEELALGSPEWLSEDLMVILGEDQVHSRVIDLIRYATDASPYRMFPKVVVSPRTVEEVSSIFAYARKKGISVTIRSAGSSLSGQSQGDGILIDARKHWAGCSVENNGQRLRVRPGTVMFRANLALKLPMDTVLGLTQRALVCVRSAALLRTMRAACAVAPRELL